MPISKKGLTTNVVKTQSDAMTSLIAWAGVDSRGPASVYLASDSRISWETGEKWDYGRKLFASHTHADLFGYCGTVFFPSLILGQFLALADAGALFAPDALPTERHKALLTLAATGLDGFPTKQRASFTIVHAGRLGLGMSSSFHLWRTDWSLEKGWRDAAIDLPTQSTLVCALGSGGGAVVRYDEKWRRSDVGRTSRAVFSAFCDALRSGDDQYSGGGPQLVGLYRKGAGELFGVLWGGQGYLLGLPAGNPAGLVVEWRNELFERCDPATGDRLTGAQRHSRPVGL